MKRVDCIITATIDLDPQSETDSEIDLDISYSVYPGSPATYWHPGDPAEIEFQSLHPAGDNRGLNDRDLRPYAEAWLSGPGREPALDVAAQQDGADPDDARDAATERRRLERES